ncbi:glutathione S-transferase L1-like [Euphorbia lathyris]|uniref:glutathione S-transferase L1-like n=1 Tax=Euphorbia lathyris TaxID=212925 RepID=UPI003313CD17
MILIVVGSFKKEFAEGLFSCGDKFDGNLLASVKGNRTKVTALQKFDDGLLLGIQLSLVGIDCIPYDERFQIFLS